MGRKKGTKASNIKDITGQKFGKLTAVELDETSKGKAWWKCLCECGNVCKRSLGTLQRGNMSSCGCFTNFPKKDPKEMAITQLTAVYKENARQRGNSFTLTREEFSSLVQGDCYYCGEVPSRDFKAKKGHAEMKYNGIDRMDNSLGYEFINCVSCCTDCNFLKNKRSHNEFLDKVKRIYDKLLK